MPRSIVSLLLRPSAWLLGCTVPTACLGDDAPPVVDQSSGASSGKTPSGSTTTRPPSDGDTTMRTTTDDGGSSSGGSSTTEAHSASTGSSTTEAGSGSSTTGPALVCHDEELDSTVPQVVMGTLVGAGDDRVTACGGDPGAPDWVYRFTTPQEGVYRFEAQGRGLLPTVAVWSDCEGTSLGCDGPGGEPARVEVLLASMQPAWVVVDAAVERSGEYSLALSRLEFGGDELCTPWGDMFPGCGRSGAQTMPGGGMLSCDDSGVLWFDVYEIPVEAGDCVFVSADNVDPAGGPTGLPAGDLAIVVRDELGHALSFDDEVPCSDPAFGGFGCPQGGAVAAVDGVVFVGVTQYGGVGCPDPSPYTLHLAVSGIELDPTGLQIHDDLALSSC